MLNLTANRTLGEYNAKWKAFVASDKCPPVLGLAPLSSDEAVEIRRLVQSHLPNDIDERLRRLIYLLNHYSAVMCVWVARVAGEAYNDNFWSNFNRLLGVDIPPPS